MDFKDMGTLVGTAIAAVASLLNLYLMLKDRGDRYVLRIGRLYPYPYPGQQFYVVNRSKHPIVFIDYGFIRMDESLLSLPDSDANDPEDRVELLGHIDPGMLDSAGVDLGVQCIAAYAISATQRIPKLHFSSDTALLIRFKLRWRAYWGGLPALWEGRIRLEHVLNHLPFV